MSSFWEKKLGGAQQTNRPAAPPASVGNAWWQNPASQDNKFRPQQQEPTATSARARSSRETERCPECDSVNYMRPGTDPKLSRRCYDCGYPLMQTGSGVSGTGTEPVHAARQLARLNTDGFHPEMIVDRDTRR